MLIYTVGVPWEGSGVVYLAGVYTDPLGNIWKAFQRVTKDKSELIKDS